MKRNKVYLTKIICIVCTMFGYSSFGGSLPVASEPEIVRFVAPETKKDARYDYALKLLELILKHTEAKYGPTKIEIAPFPMTRDREFNALLSGKEINVSAQPTKIDWEDNLIPIRIPIEKGIVGIRLFLVKKSDRKILSNLKSIEALKKIPIGSVASWSSTKALIDGGFTVETTPKYETLFMMLSGDRFKLLPRGINEITDEYQAQSKEFRNSVAIDNRYVMYMPLPIYFFVSPNAPKLAERIEAGLQYMIKTGEFEQIFEKTYGHLLKKYKVYKREIIRLENPNVRPSLTPLLKNPKSWIQI